MLILALQLLAVTSCGDLCSAAATEQYARLNALAELNRRQNERAAFLVRTPDGMRVVIWQVGEATEAVYKGRIPLGSIAVIHTHPYISPQPSRRDVAEAVRLHLPIVVITPRSVTAAMPDGSTVQLFATGWSRSR